MVTITGTRRRGRRSAVLLIGNGRLWWGAVAVTVFVLLDMLDGALARARGSGSVFGAVLDSVGDRAADAAIFGALVWWFSGDGDNRLIVLLALLCLVLGVLTSYIKARAEGVGLSADVGIVERTERLILVLVGTGFAGLGIPYALHVMLWVLLAGSAITVGQRFVAVRRRGAAGSPPRHERRAAAPASPPAPCAALTARLTDAGFAAGWHAVRLLPEPAARGAFDRAGRWAAGRDGKGTRQLRANLRVVTGGRLSEPELADLTGRAVRSYARYWQEAFRLPSLRSDRIVAGHRRRRPRAPREGPRRRAAVIMALPHSGNWDAAGVWFIDWLGGPFMTVAERLQPESLFERFVAFRESLGFRVVPLTGGPRPSTEVLREWLADGGADLPAGRPQPGQPAECRSTFFGRTATLPGGAAAARRPDRGRAGPDRLPVHRRRAGGWCSPRRCPSPAPAGSRTASPRPCRPSPTTSPPRSPTGRRTGTCSAASGPTCRPTPPAGGPA